MIRLALKLALSAAALWAVWTFVPIDGRTLADRWRSAGNVATFLARAGAEVAGRPIFSARPQARTPRSAEARERPSERLTDADRRAVDRLLSERLTERR